MLNRRGLLALLTSAGIVAVGGSALAKKKIHKNGKALLGGKLKKNGKHHIDKVGKGGKATIDANVKGRKVASMSLFDADGKEITGRKIKSKKKMALSTTPQVTFVAANTDAIQLAQLDWYYGWYFFYDDDDYYYWYDAEDVYWEEDDWADEDEWLYW
jgi:hypothetical protein